MSKRLFFRPSVLQLLIAALFSSFFMATTAAAAPGKQVFRVDQLLGDGSSGYVFRQWKQNLPERSVAKVVAEVRRVRGDSNTFLNLRYGSGQSFENGRQVFLKDGNYTTVSWTVNRAPGGQPLVLNAYKGEVQLRTVIVTYSGASQTGSIGASTGSPNSRPDYRDKRDKYRGRDYSNRDDRYRDRDDYRDDRYRDRDDYRDDRYSGDDVNRFCRDARYRAPRIEVDEFRSSGGLFSGKYRVNGSVYAACVEEAGYFESGRLKQEFKFPFSDRYRREGFSIQVRTGKNGEIRVLSADGSNEVVRIDDLARQSNQGQNQQGQGGLLGGILNN